jgi:hypothetical protein
MSSAGDILMLVNSDINKTLDIRIEETKEEIKQFILSTKKLVIADDELIIWNNEIILSPDLVTEAIIGTLTPQISGFARMTITISGDGSSTQYLFQILENNSLKYEYSIHPPQYEDSIKSYEAEFKANKAYTFKIIARGNYPQGHFKRLTLNAKVIDGFPYNHTIGG